MIKANVKGIVLGGLAGYLILSKGLNVMSNCVRNICVAREWKNYYKYGKNGNMVPPGYASHTRQINDNEEKVTESPEEIEAKRKKAQENTSNKGTGAAVTEAIVKAISDIFGSDKKAEEALEGQEKASESKDKDADEEKSVCPENCDNCQVKKCPWGHLKNGGKILEWDENGKPIAGRYPWSNGKELNWNVIITSSDEKINEPDITEEGETEEDDALTLDFSENPDGEFVDKEGNKV